MKNEKKTTETDLGNEEAKTEEKVVVRYYRTYDPYPDYDKTSDLKEDFDSGEYDTDDGFEFYPSSDR